MAKETHAYGFFIKPDVPEEAPAGTLNQQIQEIVQLLKGHAKDKADTLIEHSGHLLRVCESHWGTSKGVDYFSASVFKLRSAGLPSAVGKDGPKPLSLDPETSLGEPMCFVYVPQRSIALVPFASEGARHSAIVIFLQQIGFGGQLIADPLLHKDTMERLRHAHSVRKFDVHIRNPVDVADLKRQGRALELGLDAMEDLGGTRLKFSVSAGRTRGVLNFEKILAMAQRLAGSSSRGDVSKLSVDLSMAPGAVYETLDLFQARIVYDLEIEESSRELDRAHCKKLLLDILPEVLSEIGL